MMGAGLRGWVRHNVTSRNSHITLLTNLSQFPRIVTPVTPPCQSSILELIKSRTCLVMYFQHPSIQIPVCPLVLRFCLFLNYCPLLSHYCFLFRLLYQQLCSRTLLCFLLCLIVLSLLLFLTPVV